MGPSAAFECSHWPLPLLQVSFVHAFESSHAKSAVQPPEAPLPPAPLPGPVAPLPGPAFPAPPVELDDAIGSNWSKSLVQPNQAAPSAAMPRPVQIACARTSHLRL